MTDPARELAELCTRLQAQSQEKGESFLANAFGVEVWSREFYQIVFTISERCAHLQDIVSTLDIDADYKDELIRHVERIRSAFAATSMRSTWTGHGMERIGPIHVGPLKAISGSVRQIVSYPKLSDDEIAELEDQVSALIDWLEGRELSQADFARQAMIEGLTHFRFRLQRLQWLGWGYTLDSLQDVLTAYMLLERAQENPKPDPKSAAVLKRVGTVVKGIYEKVHATKNVAETADWVLKAFTTGSAAFDKAKPIVSALLSGS